MCSVVSDGVYLHDCQMKRPSKWAVDPVSADRLWNTSEDLVGEKFSSDTLKGADQKKGRGSRLWLVITGKWRHGMNANRCVLVEHRYANDLSGLILTTRFLRILALLEKIDVLKGVKVRRHVPLFWSEKWKMLIMELKTSSYLIPRVYSRALYYWGAIRKVLLFVK